MPIWGLLGEEDEEEGEFEEECVEAEVGEEMYWDFAEAWAEKWREWGEAELVLLVLLVCMLVLRLLLLLPLSCSRLVALCLTMGARGARRAEGAEEEEGPSREGLVRREEVEEEERKGTCEREVDMCESVWGESGKDA